MYSRYVFVVSAVLLVGIASLWPLTSWIERETGVTEVHGPMAAAVALPVILLVVIGSITLAIVVLVRKPRRASVIVVGLLPIGTILVMVAAAVLSVG